MKRRTLIVSGAIIILALVLAACQPFGQIDLARVRRATVQFRSVEVAQAAGYDLVPGLDYCFDNPGVGGMGFHYIDTASMDLTLELLHPEAMVYAACQNGELELGAVEYIVPAEPWDAAGNTEPPM